MHASRGRDGIRASVVEVMGQRVLCTINQMTTDRRRHTSEK